MNIYLGADHGGFQKKELIKQFLVDPQITVIDCGNTTYDPGDDYVDYAISVAQEVAQNESNRGILICRSGEGMCITANKIRGIRAAICHNAQEVLLAREHNNANVLVLNEHITEENLKECLHIFLNTPFSSEERHQRRVQKILDLEEKVFKK